MARYLDGDKDMLSRDEVEILLFALYLESLKSGNPKGLAAQGTALVAAQHAFGKKEPMKGTMIFVFGSNEQGVHGAGAAKVAQQRYGAVRGVGEGHEGNSYALPTRKYNRATGVISTLDLPAVQAHVDTFIKYAKSRQDLTFQVTAIGTGHAGLTHAQMAPMFVLAPENCQFDTVWETWLKMPGRKFWGTY